MFERTLKKWKDNWEFLLKATTAQALSTLIAVGCIPRGYDVPHVLPIPTRILCWPLLSCWDLTEWEVFRGASGWFLFLVLFWNAFLWAVALLELKQVLARTLMRNPRAPD